MAFDPQEMRATFCSTPCVVCHDAVGGTGVFKIRRDASGTSWFGPYCPTHRPVPLEGETIEMVAERIDRAIDFLASPEGITAEEEIIQPAVERALNDLRRRKTTKGGA